MSTLKAGEAGGGDGGPAEEALQGGGALLPSRPGDHELLRSLLFFLWLEVLTKFRHKWGKIGALPGMRRNRGIVRNDT